MKINALKKIIAAMIIPVLFGGCSSGGSGGPSTGAIIADHSVARLSVLESIPDSAINNAKSTLIVAYGHTSHGSQIRSGMNGLDDFTGGTGLYSFYDTTDGDAVVDGALDFRDFYGSFGGGSANDLGNPDYTTWASETRAYLEANSDVNVVVWSWCGQVSGRSEQSMIDDYLEPMTQLEEDFPDVKFVYMTGHLDGTGLEGNLHLRNEQIRKYCRDNNKILFDFADIESYDPDGLYYGDKHPTDACNYDYDGDGTTSQSGDPASPAGNDKNWATDWQNSHTEGVDWYNCGAAHSKSLNANMKAYAFWWLMARVSGWSN